MTEIYYKDRIDSETKLIAYTDGSCWKNKISTCGISYVNGYKYGLKDNAFTSIPPHTSARAEMFCI